MPTSIDRAEPAAEEIRRRLRELPLAALRGVLTERVVSDACKRHGYKWRQRKYGPLVTVVHLVLKAVGREGTFASTWQDLMTAVVAEVHGAADKKPELSGLTHARARLPKAVVLDLANWACSELGAGATTWHGLRLRAFDGCTVSMPRDAALVEHFGLHRTKHGMARYPLARFVSLLNLGECTIADWQFGLFTEAEVALARRMMGSLSELDLVLVDRGFTGSPTLARIRARAAHFLGRKNARLREDKVTILRRLGRNDWIVELPIGRDAKKADEELPDTTRVRLFKATWRAPSGERVTEWFVTSLEDRTAFPPKMLAALYYERWRIETSYLEFKQTFHADVLRSKSVETIEKEFAAQVLGYQLVRHLIVEAARTHDKKPTEISFLNAARWTISFSRHMARAHVAELPEMHGRLLAAIAANEVDIRPGRLKPRAVARERKHYPALREDRGVWRARRLAQGSRSHGPERR